jgi:hypothetical protein
MDFRYLNRSRIIERIRNREYVARSSLRARNSSGSTSSALTDRIIDRDAENTSKLWNIAHNFREEIMAYTQVDTL